MDNAKNWSYTTQVILERHYEREIEQTTAEIKNLTEDVDWLEAFEVAVGWAY